MEKSNICIVVLVGLPGSGKTSFCNNFIKNPFTDLIIRIFTYDKLCTDYTSTARKNVFEFVGMEIKSATKLNKQFVFIIDDNMFYKSMRQEYFNLARVLGTGFLQIYFQVRLETALARNSKRIHDRVPDAIIKSMASKLEIPKKYMVLINSEVNINECFYQVVKCIYDSFSSPLKYISSEPKRLPMSKLQNVDLCLRKLVNKKISENPDFAKIYIKIKSIVFRNVKKGLIDINFQCNITYMFLGDFFEI